MTPTTTPAGELLSKTIKEAARDVHALEHLYSEASSTAPATAAFWRRAVLAHCTDHAAVKVSVGELMDACVCDDVVPTSLERCLLDVLVPRAELVPPTAFAPYPTALNVAGAAVWWAVAQVLPGQAERAAHERRTQPLYVVQRMHEAADALVAYLATDADTDAEASAVPAGGAEQVLRSCQGAQSQGSDAESFPAKMRSAAAASGNALLAGMLDTGDVATLEVRVPYETDLVGRLFFTRTRAPYVCGKDFMVYTGRAARSPDRTLVKILVNKATASGGSGTSTLGAVVGSIFGAASSGSEKDRLVRRAYAGKPLTEADAAQLTLRLSVTRLRGVAAGAAAQATAHRAAALASKRAGNLSLAAARLRLSKDAEASAGRAEQAVCNLQAAQARMEQVRRSA